MEVLMADRDLLEAILTTQVLILGKQLATEKKAKGTSRLGGDYLKEAVDLIRKKQPEVLALLK
jgi:hypothetical protein